jgi:predicted MPP superfamily phosphohydrolase
MRRFWQFPILCAAVAVLAVALIDWSVIPMNEAGRHQWATGWLAGIARLLQFPGLLVGRKLRLHVGLRPALTPWCVMMATNVPLYLFGAVVARWMWTAGRRSQTGAVIEPRFPGAAQPCEFPDAQFTGHVQPVMKGNEMVRSADPAKLTARRSLPTRRQFLVAGNRLALAGAAATLGYSFVDREQFIITRRTVPIRGLPPTLHGMTIAQLTDIHHGPWTSLAYVRRIVDTTNALNPDLIALTGDYILYSPTYVRPVTTELTGLRAKIGILGVLGNHDWSDAGPVTLSEFRRAGLRLIDNSRMFISPDRQLSRKAPKQGLCIGGLADLWGGRPDFSHALGGVAHEMPRVLLSHNPDTAEMPVARDRRHRVDLMLSGHTHGGQINIPGIGSPFIPSAYGQKYAYDLVHGPAFRVFVSSGLGTNVIPLRFCRPPEIAVLTLERDG